MNGYRFEGKRNSADGLIELNYSLGAFKQSVSFWFGDITVHVTDVTLYTDGEDLTGVWVGGEDGHGNYIEDKFGELAPSSIAELAQELFEDAKAQGHI